jgi:hypothetical protein
MKKKIALFGFMSAVLLAANANAVQIASTDYVEARNSQQTVEIEEWVVEQGYITDADISGKVDEDVLGTAAFESVTAFATAEQGNTATAISLSLTENDTIAKANNALQTADLGDYATVDDVETYAIPKPTANCLGAQAQCVLSINKQNGSIYWEDVAIPQP